MYHDFDITIDSIAFLVTNIPIISLWSLLYSVMLCSFFYHCCSVYQHSSYHRRQSIQWLSLQLYMLIVATSATIINCNADDHDSQLITTIAQVELQILISKTLMNCSELCNYVKIRGPIVFNLSKLSPVKLLHYMVATIILALCSSGLVTKCFNNSSYQANIITVKLDCTVF